MSEQSRELGKIWGADSYFWGGKMVWITAAFYLQEYPEAACSKISVEVAAPDSIFRIPLSVEKTMLPL
ncbi:MAG: hypothetical protein LBN18_08765 [Dysgonamonadaceae bacterium]|nr:hypothetical protein [Dysgonamonadaceae bacterium]